MSIEIIHGGGLPELAAFIGKAISDMDPIEAQAVLGAMFANICGNIPDKEWEQLKEAAKLPCNCGDPDCKVAINAVIEGGEKARNQLKKVLDHKKDRPDEKGFSA